VDPTGSLPQTVSSATRRVQAVLDARKGGALLTAHVAGPLPAETMGQACSISGVSGNVAAVPCFQLRSAETRPPRSSRFCDLLARMCAATKDAKRVGVRRTLPPAITAHKYPGTRYRVPQN